MFVPYGRGWPEQRLSLSPNSLLRPLHLAPKAPAWLCAGALVGGMVGLSGIPRRFLDGLTHGEELSQLAVRLAQQAFPGAGEQQHH